MSKNRFIKYLGGALGWALGGPLGGILGFIAGSVFEAGAEFKDAPEGRQHFSSHINNNSPGDFSAALLVLSAAVMKADGKIVTGELDYVKEFFKLNFGAEVTRQRMLMLREILKKEIPVRDICLQIKQHVNHSARLEMLHFLFGIAVADHAADPTEMAILKNIAYWLGISEYDYESIKAMFTSGKRTDDIANAYTILETTPHASEEELKKAYRRMAVRFHPDKVSHLGEEYKKDAEEKFKKVQQAWIQIRKERNIN